MFYSFLLPSSISLYIFFSICFNSFLVFLLNSNFSSSKKLYPLFKIPSFYTLTSYHLPYSVMYVPYHSFFLNPDSSTIDSLNMLFIFFWS